MFQWFWTAVGVCLSWRCVEACCWRCGSPRL